MIVVQCKTTGRVWYCNLQKIYKRSLEVVLTFFIGSSVLDHHQRIDYLDGGKGMHVEFSSDE